MSNPARESSVIFNLRQLMQLEQERVAREEEQAQQLRTREQARLEREQRAAAERQALLEHSSAQRVADPRAELLRAQLEASIAERTRERRLNSDRAREIAQLHAANARDRVRLLKRAGLVLVLSSALAGAGQWIALQRTAEARAAAQMASGLVVAQTRELAGLRARLMNAHIEAVPTQPDAVSPAAAEPTRATNSARRVPRVRATPAKARASKLVPDLDLDADDLDPINGL